MTATILVALVALSTAVFASALLTPSGRSAAPAFLPGQRPDRQALRATLLGLSSHATSARGRQARALRRTYP